MPRGLFLELKRKFIRRIFLNLETLFSFKMKRRTKERGRVKSKGLSFLILAIILVTNLKEYVKSMVWLLLLSPLTLLL